MVCPKCNAELKEGHLYCENCGAEIRIVPDFEPEIEESMNLSLSGVAEAISEPQSIENEQKKKSQKKRRAKSGKKMMVTSSLAFFALCVVGVIVIGLSRYYSYDYQYEKAMREYESGNFESAVITAKHAVSINPDEEKSKLLLADTYFSLQKYDESIAVLMGMLDLFPDDSDIYERLVANYEIKGDVESIGELIKNCGDNTIMAEFDAYVSVAPSFSIEEGTYYEAEFLSLLSDGNGTIYYTLDGELPDEHSKKYKSPISLKEGTTVVSAIYVNEKGIVSDPVQKTYTIKFKLPKVPVLLTKSGNYDSPVLIKIKEPKEGIIYYTDDGSDPTKESEIYTLPIPMPLGTSQFKFVNISKDGIASEIITAEYTLQIATIVDTTAAEAAIQFFLQTKGDTTAGCEYLCTSAYGAGSRTYYMIDEYENSSGNLQKTGRIFAVDVCTGELYKANINIVEGDYEFSFLY